MSKKNGFLTWILCTLAFGCIGTSFAANGSLPQKALLTDIMSPVGMIYDKDGTIFVAEWGANRVSSFDRRGKRALVCDGIASPAGLAFDGDGVLYIASYGDGKIYSFDGRRGLREFASGLAAPTGLLWSDDGSLLVANRNAGEVVKIFPDGRKKTISSNHKTPVGLARTEDGTLFVSCYGGSVDCLLPGGERKSIYSRLSMPGVGIIAAGPQSALVVDYGAGNIARVNASGQVEIVKEGLGAPVGLAKMPDGNVVVACWGDNSAHVLGNL